MNGVFSVIVLSMTTLAAAPNQPGWLRDYGKALQTTRTSKQPLLVVLHNPEDPQQRVDEVDTGSARLLQAFTLCQIDVTTNYGKKVAAAFGAKEFPYTVITNKTGDEIVLRRLGRFSPGQWDETLLSYRDGKRHATATARFASANVGTESTRVEAYKPVLDAGSFDGATTGSPIAPAGSPATSYSFPSFGMSGAACRT